MQFAIEKLEVVESNLKETIEMFSKNKMDTRGLKEKLDDVQTAILVLNSSQEIVNIGRILALKNLQK